MNKVGRIVPPNKQILRDISLGFYYGAKIGVLGLNGAGKSTLIDPTGKGETRNQSRRGMEPHDYKNKAA